MMNHMGLIQGLRLCFRLKSSSCIWYVGNMSVNNSYLSSFRARPMTQKSNSMGTLITKCTFIMELITFQILIALECQSRVELSFLKVK